MKRFFLVIVFLTVCLHMSFAAGPDRQYVQIYSIVQDADQLRSNGQSVQAREKYEEAQKQLKKLHDSYPNWNPDMVKYRLGYLAERLGEPQAAGATPSGEAMPALVPIAPRPAPAQSAPKPQSERPAPKEPVRQSEAQTAESDQQVQALMLEVQRLQGEKAVLEARLREALTAQPAAVDPRELAKAEERIRALEKEREVLKVALEQEKTRPQPQVEVASLEELRKALAEANEQLRAQTEKAVALGREKEILETRLQSMRKADEVVASLREENATLKKQLADATTTARTLQTAAAQSAANDSIAGMQNALRQLQSEKAALERNKAELEQKLAATPALPVKPSPAEADRVKQLENDRDELQRKLNETSRQLYENKTKTESVQRQQFDDELARLKARMEILEARKVPYTPEELALFKQPTTAPASTKSAPATKPLREPAGARALIAEAERAFAARRYAEAEQKYKQILQLDQENIFTLANLAASQLEQNRLDEAEANLTKALTRSPDDSHSLMLMGILKFRQENYDDALDMLARAAQLDPANPETQNYLGITLSQKGQRGPAETALRKAVQLAPGYGGAHHNLAVVYATQQPPFVELARWHYQKALAAGHPQNPELEKLLERNESASAK